MESELFHRLAANKRVGASHRSKSHQRRDCVNSEDRSAASFVLTNLFVKQRRSQLKAESFFQVVSRPQQSGLIELFPDKLYPDRQPGRG